MYHLAKHSRHPSLEQLGSMNTVCCDEICCWGYVYIEDKLPQIIECESVEVPCYDIASAPDPVVVENNCGNTELILLNEVIDHQDCDDEYTAIITRRWVAKDKAGNYGNEKENDHGL